MTEPPSSAASPERTWAALAERAATDVNSRFGHRLLRLPGTWIGSLRPGTPRVFQPPWTEWHYWWQAHYLDALIDGASLALQRGDWGAAHAELRRARHLLRGILIRNFGRFPNYFFDDMAWLALATHRMNKLSLRLTAKPSRLALSALASLTRQLHSAHDPVLGGGLYWSRKRDFKNTPVNGPAALHFARTGQVRPAREIADWLRRELFNLETGLYIDGVHPTPTGRSVENTVYTYNQGPILAALLELGSPADVAHAAELIDAIKTHLSTPGSGIRLEPGGDGSLFTGILCRYLALAAQDLRLPERSRQTASNLIQETAQQVLEQEPVLLSAAIQRWMILSAASGITQAQRPQGTQ